MLPTTAIKADPSVASATKDNAAPSTLEASFSSYFSQMMAELPSFEGSPAAQIQAPPPSPPAQRPADPAKKTTQGTQSSQSSQSTQSAPADGSTSAGAQAPASTQAQSPASTTAPSAQQTAAAAAAAAPAVLNQTGGAAPDAQARTAAGASDGSAAPAQGSAPAAPAAPPAPTPPAPAASTTQNALDQAYPGGKFQVSYDDQDSPATTKAPLTEFVNQIQMDSQAGGDAQGGSVPAPTQAALAAAALPAASALPAAALDMAAALQTLQTPLASNAALLAPAAPETSAVAGVGALSGNMAAAQAVGAGALPGAAGSVRVTASAASEDTLPTGQQSILSQVDGSIRWLVKNQDQGAELQLHPESLGRVQIKLKVEGTVVHAKVWASEASAVPVLQDHRAMLESSLKAQGLTLGSFDLQHGRKDQQAPLPTPTETASGSSASQQPAFTGQETPVPQAAAPARTSRIEYVA